MRIKTYFFALLCLLATVRVAAQGKELDFKLDRVNEIVVEGKFTLVVVQGEEDRLTGSCPADLSDYLSWQMTDGEVLSVRLATPLNMGQTPMKDTIQFTLHLASELRDVKASKGARVISDDMLNMDKLDVTATSDAFVSLRVDCHDLSINSSNSGVIFMYGSSTFTDVRVNSQGRVDTQDLVTEVAVVDAQVDGRAVVTAERKLKLDAKTRGSIEYIATDDTVVRKKESSYGKIKKI